MLAKPLVLRTSLGAQATVFRKDITYKIIKKKIYPLNKITFLEPFTTVGLKYIIKKFEQFLIFFCW